MFRMAIYSGSFDMPTKGHEWVIMTAAGMFDKLYVAVGYNPGKQYMFTVEERVNMLNNLDIAKRVDLNIEVISFKNRFLIDVAEDLAVDYIVRGIRSESDYQFERSMLDINNRMCSDSVNTVFLMPPTNLQLISSSVVKGLIGYDGWHKRIREFVPSNVYDTIIKKVDGK